ncbi:MAG TPA: phosphotyrosine protein phosphatase [Porphyromonadaceae bacterium]|jgi:protein-tyrosine phosphatase|uniref:low molecular weight protein-tyrosine-phosphatase n=1 Tax=Limibacterium fermenti TaxID=3229863 RepID=UPI000E96EBB6|nr:phosphotyrosine protein phosphatase [Porphyromonadaceae bacterium]HBK32044.1 phosphotyrosine protein phosphatase [Porphyromonadaceae bacterium]HBL33100.1 phosphotyrosine protein phosphatase [Porphyromonadaceae bacterium]HBX20305.1 phosphotyrosine protein phosphatase [Porphyromonadaceae bacterium]HBX44899.1 phosphotyrosine protein phosphatase [Porphyromonadaceae bacterium]
MKLQDSNKKKIRILFVCLGNICRSPAAESVMNRIIEKNNLQDSIETDSAGTSGWHEGDLPDERMRAHGEKRGYAFLSRARRFTKKDFQNFDYIIAMDDQNYMDVKSMAITTEDERKIHRMTEFSRQYSHDHIPDPYFGGTSGFELVLDLLEDACLGLMEVIIDKEDIE